MFRVEIWICATLFALGIIAGMTYLDMSSEGTVAPPIAQASSQASALPQISPGSGLSDENSDPYEYKGSRPQSTSLSKGDRYLIAGNYAVALDHYYKFEKSTANAGSAVLLREALCCEMQHKFGVAQQKYYRAFTDGSFKNHQLLGIAGLARCLTLDGKRMEALELLSEQTLKLDQYRNVPEEVRAQLSFQFAKALESNAIEPPLDLTSSHGVAFHFVDPKPEDFLGVVDQTEEPPDALEIPTGPEFKILQRPSSSLTVISANIRASHEPVLRLIGQIAAGAELELKISHAAGAVVQNRARTVDLDSVPLSSVLDTLLVPFDLVWYQVDSELNIVARHELDPAVAKNQFWFDAAHRAFRRFELTFGDGDRRLAALLSRANLSLVQNRLDLAANQYQELRQTKPGDEILAKLFFNQAKLNILLNRKEEANRLLYLAVDQTLEPNLEASAYCLLGNNLLSGGDLESTIKVSRRGIAAAVNARQKQLTSLNLARAYLLKGDPFSANNVLYTNREYYEDSPVKPIASILGTYARFVGVSDENGIRVARNRLISAVAMIPESDYESFADSYFAALAFEKLGFREKAIDKLLLTLAKPDVGVWGRQIVFELAILQKRLGQTKQATRTLESLVKADETGQWNLLALEQLAQIFMETKQSELCIETCKKLWNLPLDEDQKRMALQLLGEAYQLKGEHHTAALCFAGMLPDEL